MAKQTTKIKAGKYNFKLVSISLVEKFLQSKGIEEKTKFEFAISLELVVDFENQILIVLVNVAIKPRDTETIVASVKTAFSFHVLELAEIVKIENDQPIIPYDLELRLRAIGISSSRGIVYSEFRGTFLQNAMLPILSHSAFHDAQYEEAKKIHSPEDTLPF